MVFIELFFKGKKEIKPEDINLFISQKIEENTKLDYKDIRAYHNADHLTTHVSSFANSEGGLIILGVSQDEIRENARTIKIFPKEVTWGEASLDKESLENKLVTKITPPISGVTIRPVRNENNKVIFLIDIPKSNFAPHMASDYRYHKRINFRIRRMEHYEVSNLFRINWTMKEKLVEKIYEPLSSVLEKHTKRLEEYSCPFTHDFDEILSRTYYKIQMPSELLEKIDHYVDQIKDLDKKEYYTKRAMNAIVNKNVSKYLKKECSPLMNELNLVFRVFSESSSVELSQHDIYKLLLTNKKVKTYLNTVYFRQVYEKIQIQATAFGDQFLNLDEFDEHIWEKCLKEASEDARVTQLRKSAETLYEEAWDLIEDITNY